MVMFCFVFQEFFHLFLYWNWVSYILKLRQIPSTSIHRSSLYFTESLQGVCCAPEQRIFLCLGYFGVQPIFFAFLLHMLGA